MQGDFTRDTFRRANHFSRVLTQQGRVHLDAEDNEQTSILLHYLRTLAADLIGPHGGPFDGTKAPGFAISVNKDSNSELTDLTIEPGRYYVQGILCENEATVTYYGQSDAFWDETRSEDQLPTQFPFLVYLDLWERHITAIQAPKIREVALGPNGPDTSSRAKVVWQVKTAAKLPDGTVMPRNRDGIEAKWDAWTEKWQPAYRGKLNAHVGTGRDPKTDPCIVSPESRYRGAENQLYRVEVHTGATAAGGASFKWSRENASVVFEIEPVADNADNVVILRDQGRDTRLSLAVGDWVEIVDDDFAVRSEPAPLFQVTALPGEGEVGLDRALPGSLGRIAARHPLLRRWDHKADDKIGDPRRGAIPIVETTTGDDGWLPLEDGIEIQFQAGATYRHGDYWLIPARTETGDVDWDDGPGAPLALPPHGVEHYYAPLALVLGVDAGQVIDLRRQFNHLAHPSGT